MITRSGFLIGDLTAGKVDLSDLPVDDICQSLANIQRWRGGLPMAISVAEHSVRLARAVPKGLAKIALVHDIEEIFIGDIPSPLKDLCTCSIVETVSKSINEGVYKRFGMNPKVAFIFDCALKPYDTAIRASEIRSAFGARNQPGRWRQVAQESDPDELLPRIRFRGWPPSAAAHIYRRALSRHFPDVG